MGSLVPRFEACRRSLVPRLPYTTQCSRSGLVSWWLVSFPNPRGGSRHETTRWRLPMSYWVGTRHLKYRKGGGDLQVCFVSCVLRVVFCELCFVTCHGWTAIAGCPPITYGVQAHRLQVLPALIHWILSHSDHIAFRWTRARVHLQPIYVRLLTDYCHCQRPLNVVLNRTYWC